MALIGANELKKKMLIEYEGQPYNVLEVFFATPTARGASTMVRTKMKNLLNGAVLEKSFKTSEKFGEPNVELATVSFLYSDPDGFHFMDASTFEQFTLSSESVGDDRYYLKEGLNLELGKCCNTFFQKGATSSRKICSSHILAEYHISREKCFLSRPV